MVDQRDLEDICCTECGGTLETHDSYYSRWQSDYDSPPEYTRIWEEAICRDCGHFMRIE